MKGVVKIGTLTKNRNKGKMKYVLWYYFAFYVIWIFCETFIFPNYVEANSIKSVIIYEVITLNIWVTSGLVFIKHILGEAPLEYLKMSQNIRLGIVKGIKYSLPILGFYIVSNLLLGKTITFEFKLLKLVGGIVLVGVTEEPIFRGIIMRELNNRYNFAISNALTSFLFLIIHFPKWIIRGYFGSILVLGMILSVFITSFYLGYVYKKGNSLWSSIMVHSINNFIVSVFI